MIKKGYIRYGENNYDCNTPPSSSQEQSASHPLWLARVIQGLNKSLERLRKESGGDIMAVKTSLEILNTIFRCALSQ